MQRIVLILLASGYIAGFGIIDLEQRRTKWTKRKTGRKVGLSGPGRDPKLSYHKY